LNISAPTLSWSALLEKGVAGSMLDERIVFILGAGASQHAGAPLMSNFLSVARELAHERQLPAFDLVFSAINSLHHSQAKSEFDLENLEMVFGAFQMARRLGMLGNLSDREIENLPSAMSSVIASTLDEHVWYPADKEGWWPTEGYGALASMIRDLRVSRCSILTFNYDVALDYSLYAMGLKIDYGLDSDVRHADDGRLPVLKLHGSLNWSRCSTCKIIRPFEGRPVAHRTSEDRVLLRCSPHLSMSKHCDVATDVNPVVIPPTWEKASGHDELINVWRRAARELSRASHIIVLGYSMPESDMFFRYLYALGSIGDPMLRSFRVFDPNKEVHARFRGMLSSNAQKVFRPGTSGYFVDSINEIGKAFRAKPNYGQSDPNQASMVQRDNPNSRVPFSEGEPIVQADL
jgi:NAD-dependent SIR2 family protein deacetylase